MIKYEAYKIKNAQAKARLNPKVGDEYNVIDVWGRPVRVTVDRETPHGLEVTIGDSFMPAWAMTWRGLEKAIERAKV